MVCMGLRQQGTGKAGLRCMGTKDCSGRVLSKSVILTSTALSEIAEFRDLMHSSTI